MNIISRFFNDFKILSSLTNKARQQVSRGQSIAILAPLVKEFLASEEPKNIMSMCIAEFERNPNIDPPFLGPEHIVFCNDIGGLFIGLGHSKSGDNTIPLYSSPSEVLLGAASTNGFSYQKSLVVANWKKNVFSASSTLGHPKYEHCAHGDCIFISTSTIFDYESTGDLVLKIAGPTTTELMWEFDRVSRNPLRVFASTIDATTTTYILRFLSQYGNRDSEDAVEKLVNHPFYYIRWEAIKALGEMNSNRLAKNLKYLLSDEHPDIRKASLSTLAELGEDNGDYHNFK